MHSIALKNHAADFFDPGGEIVEAEFEELDESED